ncbi:MAG: hypothetical protein ACRC4W_01405 [Treponemataceae bacterium]
MNSKEKNHEKKSIQKILVSIGSIIVLVLAAISFIFLPAMTSVGQKTTPPLGKYKKKPIEYKQDSYFTRMYASYADQERKSGKEITSANTYEVMNNAFKATVLNMAFTDQVKSSQYIAPDNLLDRKMITYFQDEDGVFSPKRFRDYPNSQKTMLRKNIEADEIFQRYNIDFMGSDSSGFSTKQEGFGGLKRSSKQSAFIAKLGSNEKAFDLIAFSKNDYPEAEAVNFAKSNTNLFVEYDISLLSFQSEEKAKTVEKQLRSNELVFEDAVSEFSTKIYTNDTGKLNNSFYFQVKNLIKTEKDLESVINLKAEELSSVFELSNGYGLFKMNASPESVDFTKQTTIDAVLSYMKDNEAGLIEDYFLARAKDFIIAADTTSFDKAAGDFELEKATTVTFPLNYNNNPMFGQIPTSTPILTGAATNENFLKELFSLELNELSKPLVLGHNIVVAKMIEEKKGEESLIDESNFIYSYYPFTFDQKAMEEYYMKSSDLENNLFNVYLTHFTQF